MRKSIPAIAVGAAAVLMLGSFGASEALAKDVTLSIDGTSSHVRVLTGTVAEVLTKQRVQLNEHDTVAPALNTPVSDGSEITVRYARPVTVNLDGTPRTLWITATSVDEALAAFGVRAEGAQLSTSRDLAIGREGITVDVTTPRNVTVTSDGAAKPVQAIGTIADAITAAGVTVNPNDVVTPALDTVLVDGAQVTIVRVTTQLVSKTIAVAFSKQKKDDATLTVGTTKTSQKGADGVTTETWTQVLHDGIVAAEEKTASVLSQAAVDEIILVGTKPKPAASTSSSSTSTSAPAASSSSSNLTPATGNTCVASNYWEGQMTATGEVFNPNAMTAAHKTLPFNTMVKVTNPANGRSVVVRINDRGPYIGGRCLDLSRAAFAVIASPSAGVATVNWQIV